MSTTTIELDPRVDAKARIAYHTVDASRLGLVTLEGLKSAGVPADFLTGVPGAASVVSALPLTEHARELLPPQLSGRDGMPFAGAHTLLRATVTPEKSGGARPSMAGVGAALAVEELDADVADKRDALRLCKVELEAAAADVRELLLAVDEAAVRRARAEAEVIPPPPPLEPAPAPLLADDTAPPSPDGSDGDGEDAGEEDDAVLSPRAHARALRDERRLARELERQRLQDAAAALAAQQARREHVHRTRIERYQAACARRLRGIATSAAHEQRARDRLAEVEELHTAAQLALAQAVSDVEAAVARQGALAPAQASPHAGASGGGGSSPSFALSVRPPPREEQQHAVASALMHRLGSEARAIMSRVGQDFRLTKAAIWEAHGRADSTPPDLADTIWLEVARAQQCQRRGYEIIRDSAKDASVAGKTGQRVLSDLGAAFDVVMAGLITHGGLRVTLSPLELAVGYVPVLQLALVIWYQGHTPRPAAAGGLLAAAKALTFRTATGFDPRPKWIPFQEAYATAQHSFERFDAHDVYEVLLLAMSKGGSPHETELAVLGVDRAAATVSDSLRGARSWALILGQQLDLQEGMRNADPPERFSRKQLDAFVYTLRSLVVAFADAHDRLDRAEPRTCAVHAAPPAVKVVAESEGPDLDEDLFGDLPLQAPLGPRDAPMVAYAKLQDLEARLLRVEGGGNGGGGKGGRGGGGHGGGGKGGGGKAGGGTGGGGRRWAAKKGSARGAAGRGPHHGGGPAVARAAGHGGIAPTAVGRAAAVAAAEAAECPAPPAAVPIDETDLVRGGRIAVHERDFPDDVGLISTGDLQTLGIVSVLGVGVGHLALGDWRVPLFVGPRHRMYVTLYALEDGSLSFVAPRTYRGGYLRLQVDSATDVTLVPTSSASLMTRRGTTPAYLAGFDGTRSVSLTGGYLDIVLPRAVAGNVPRGLGPVLTYSQEVESARSNRVHAMADPVVCRIQATTLTPGFPGLLPMATGGGCPLGAGPPDEEAAERTDAGACAVVARVQRDRPGSAFTPLKSARSVAERLNIFHHTTARAYGDMVHGVDPFVLADGVDLSCGMLQRVLGKLQPSGHLLNTPAFVLRERIPPGHMWWSDISNPRPPDFDGNRYVRYFAEQRTGFAKVFFSPDKTAKALVAHLVALEDWIRRHVPGAWLRFLRCDFGSEYAVQGRGNDVMTAAITEFSASRPGFRVIPVAPRMQAHDKVEGTAGRLNGLAFVNATRARIGGAGWSLMTLAAEYQYNHSPPTRKPDDGSAWVTRTEALRGERPDVSRMIGFPGQGGWALDPNKRINAFRLAAAPVLFICPAEEASGHLCFNFSRGTLDVVGAVSLITDPAATLGALVVSDMFDARGLVSSSPQDEVAARVRDMLVPNSEAFTSAFVIDPWTGMPARQGVYEPWLGADGEIVMVDPADPARQKEHAVPLRRWQRVEPGSSGVPSWALVDVETDAADRTGDDAGGAVVDAAPSLVREADDRVAHPGETLSAWSRRFATTLLEGPPERGIRFQDGPVKKDESGRRYAAYQPASTIGMFLALHMAYFAANPPASKTQKISPRRDLQWDLMRGIAQAEPLPYPVVGYAAAVGEPPLDPGTLTWAAEVASLNWAHLERLETAGPPPRDQAAAPESPGAASRFSAAHVNAVQAVQAALDESVRDGEECAGPDDPDRGVTTTKAPLDPVVVRMAMQATPDPAASARAAPDPIAPRTVREAQARPDYATVNGWRDAMNKEIRRIEGFGAWKVVPGSVLRESLRLYPERTSVGHLVPVLTCKRDASGDPRAPEVVNKFRVALSDPANDSAVNIQTHSSCVDPVSDMVVTAIAPYLNAVQTTIDVSGAYYHGRPPSAAEGGRNAFAHLPSWLEGLGTLGYRGRSASGERMYLLIEGNMPGKRDAGRIWQGVMDSFLRGYGMRQLTVDRRVWVKKDPLGDIIVHDHVDDTRITATADAARVAFHQAWALQFGETITPGALTEDFTGIRHHRVGPDATEISCKGVIRRLKDHIAAFPVHEATDTRSPLPADCLRRLRVGPTAKNPLVPARVAAAQQAVGAIGFCAMAARPDVSFAYQVLARLTNEARLTVYACRLIGRTIRYLLESVDEVLTVCTPHAAPDALGLDLFETDVDSSHGNGPDGLSYGGFALMSNGEGGGAIYWKTLLPGSPADSSGFSELLMGTRALKVTLAVRMLQRDLDLGVAPTAPTPLHTDAQAVLDGTGCERMHLLSRWMASRLAMMRWGVASGEISPTKRDSAEMVSDILTKPLGVQAFLQARTRIMGRRVARAGGLEAEGGGAEVRGVRR